jgi:hypothetical protein
VQSRQCPVLPPFGACQLRSLDPSLKTGSELYYGATPPSSIPPSNPWVGVISGALTANEVTSLHSGGEKVEAWVGGRPYGLGHHDVLWG